MWNLAGKNLQSRLLLGTANYSSLQTLQSVVTASETEVITLSITRQHSPLSTENFFWKSIKNTGCHLLPNTAGCRDAESAVTCAEISRELFNTNWIKLEVIGDDYNLQPDPFELVKAAERLIKKGFEVFPYCTDDQVLCKKLQNVGCRILMPWAAPIGSGKGLLNPYALETLRQRFPDMILIIDAGIGRPSHAVRIMEMGYDAVLLNTAVAISCQPEIMAAAFRHAVQAGQMAFEAGLMLERNMAQSCTPLLDTPFWHQELLS